MDIGTSDRPIGSRDITRLLGPATPISFHRLETSLACFNGRLGNWITRNVNRLQGLHETYSGRDHTETIIGHSKYLQGRETCQIFTEKNQRIEAEIQGTEIVQEMLGSGWNMNFRNFVAVQVESLKQRNTFEDTLPSAKQNNDSISPERYEIV